MAEDFSKPAGSARGTLVAMILAGSVVLVDQTAVPLAIPHIITELDGGSVTEGQWILTANLLPLAALMVIGGRLGDMFGQRRMFLAGAVGFLVATILATTAQNMEMLIAARIVQGASAALVMPNSFALVNAVFPPGKRGSALGYLAGGTAFFAALGPIVGGTLTEIDWRLIFLINSVLILVALFIALRYAPDTEPGERQPIDYPGFVTLAVSIAAFVYGIGQFAVRGGSPAFPLAVSALFGVAFVLVESRARDPLVDFRLLRHPHFLMSNISQVLAGAIELGLGFLLPFQLLLVVGVTPVVAGLALLPASLPIVFAGPLAGRAFDKYGGRWPMVVGFLALAASGAALTAAVSSATVLALVPGLVLQGIGLGIVLTVNDPVGLSSVPENDTGEAAGMINTAEQLGGAIGIAGFLALEYGNYMDHFVDSIVASGVKPTPEQIESIRVYMTNVEQVGERNVHETTFIASIVDEGHAAHVSGFELAFSGSVVVALIGVVLSFWLLRKDDPEPLAFKLHTTFRRARWVYAFAARDRGHRM